MKYLAAYTLLVLGGNATPSEADVTNVITAAGGAVDEAALSALVGELQGKDINELLKEGEAKIKASGGGAAAPAAAAAGAPAAAAPKAAEKPKEVEVDPMEGGMDMFGGGGGGGDY